jgi:hypothetical protein
MVHDAPQRGLPARQIVFEKNNEKRACQIHRGTLQQTNDYCSYFGSLATDPALVPYHAPETEIVRYASRNVRPIALCPRHFDGFAFIAYYFAAL